MGAGQARGGAAERGAGQGEQAPLWNMGRERAGPGGGGRYPAPVDEAPKCQPPINNLSLPQTHSFLRPIPYGQTTHGYGMIHPPGVPPFTG